jgi:D-2-hydroxyacid dehydrogenase (NADP+)
MTEILIVDRDAATYGAALAARFPQIRLHLATTADAVPEAACGAEVLIGLAPYLSEGLLARLPALRWVHALTTGLDNLLASKMLAPEVVLTRSRGIHGPQMSELAILMMLALARDFRRMLAEGDAGGWNRWPQPVLAGRRACLVGLGAIAEALAARLNAFGMEVSGVSDGRSTAPGFSRIWPRADLAAAAAAADYLIVILPYAPETHHVVNAEVLAAMPAGSILINISRGGCVDEAALLAALQSGHLGGAGLDVFAVEPLPADSPFRGLPNVIVTPHIGGMSDTYVQQALPIVAGHIAAYLAGGAAAVPSPVARR